MRNPKIRRGLQVKSQNWRKSRYAVQIYMPVTALSYAFIFTSLLAFLFLVYLWLWQWLLESPFIKKKNHSRIHRPSHTSFFVFNLSLYVTVPWSNSELYWALSLKVVLGKQELMLGELFAWVTNEPFQLGEEFISWRGFWAQTGEQEKEDNLWFR